VTWSERFSRRLQKAWFASSRLDWLSVALLDLSWLYGGLIKLRRKLYASGVMDSTQLPVPVIVVGNCIAGGAGKTPIVIEISKLLTQHGYRPGIVSRGYGRKSDDVLEVLPDTSASEAGDEPALIRYAQSAPVFVARSRSEAAQALLSTHPNTNVILCDDGLQHLALQRDIEICVFDERGIGNGRLLPAGPLREPWPRKVDIVLHRGGLDTATLGANHFATQRRLADHALRADGSHVSWAQLQQEALIAVAGIAQPQAFFDMLHARGLSLKEAIAMPDHYHFDSWSRTFHQVQWLICTQKDAVKLWATPLAKSCHIVAVPLQVELPAQFAACLLEKLSSLQLKPPIPN
jgi:tetraacyldisaccharide 4'-kinase